MMHAHFLEKTRSYRNALSTLLILIMTAAGSPDAFSQDKSDTIPGMTHRFTPFTPSSPPVSMQVSPDSDTQAFREAQCIRTGKWLGIAAGSFMGIMLVSWSATGMSWVHGSFGQNVATGVPSALIAGYVGAKTGQWVTRKIMEGKPGPGRAALRGALYGAAGGAIIMTANFVPMFLIGHALHTIEFNTSEEMIELKLIRISVVGGTLYGGTFGAMLGTAYGPGISVYMGF